jgi:hypothetical protein
MYMTNGWIILMTVSVLTTLFFAFLWWTEKKENGALRSMLPKMKIMQEIPRGKIAMPDGGYQEEPIYDDPAFLFPVQQRITALENENAGLRVDVETGCKTIESQITAINELRRLLHASQARNRAPIPLKKA